VPSCHRRGGTKTHPAESAFPHCICPASHLTYPGFSSSGGNIRSESRPPRFTPAPERCNGTGPVLPPSRLPSPGRLLTRSQFSLHHLCASRPAVWCPGQQKSSHGRLPGSRYDRFQRNRLRRFRRIDQPCRYPSPNPIRYLPELLPYHLTLAADGAPIRFAQPSTPAGSIGMIIRKA